MKKLLIILVLLLSACTKVENEDDCLIKYDFAKSIEDISSSDLIVYGKFKEVKEDIYNFDVINQFNYDVNLSEVDIVINNKQLTKSQFCAADENIEYSVNFEDVYLLFLKWDNEKQVYIPAYQQFAFIKTGDTTITYDDIFIKDDQLGYVSGLSNEITINEILNVSPIR